MLGNSYPTGGGPLSQGHVQAVNSLSSMGMLDVNSNDSSPFDINDFPQLTSRPSSAGGPQGQMGKQRKILQLCFLDVSSIHLFKLKMS
jgi:CCR4-NOT transcription complex subunit 2